MTTNIEYAPWAYRLQHKLEWDIWRLQLAQILAKAWQESRRMGKGTSIVDRIRALKATHEKECDAIATTMDEAERIAPAAYEAGHAAADNYKSDLTDMLGELRQMSNLPLGQKPIQ